MRIKRQRDDSALSGNRSSLCDKRLMSSVDAIKDADDRNSLPHEGSLLSEGQCA